MKNYKLIAMDFDGTLLNDEKKITKETKDTLLKCKEKGIKIVGVTARTLLGAEDVVPLELFDFLILNNGAYVYDVQKKKGEYKGIIDGKLAQAITEDLEPICEQIDYISGTTYYIYINKKNSSLSFIKDVESITDVKEEISRMNIFLKQPEKAQEICEQINEKYPFLNSFVMQVTGDKAWIVINPEGIDKRSVLNQVGDYLKIKMEEIIFFGDGMNDLPLMENVGYSVAMGNALDVIKEKASEVTVSNNEDGIARVLKKMF